MAFSATRASGRSTIYPFSRHAAALNFRRRERRYNFLRYKTETEGIPEAAVPEEFSKEHLRVTFQTGFFSEISDIDGILWGQQHTYLLEIKEKTPAPSRDMGPYFGLGRRPVREACVLCREAGEFAFDFRRTGDRQPRDEKRRQLVVHHLRPNGAVRFLGAAIRRKINDRGAQLCGTNSKSGIPRAKRSHSRRPLR